MEIEFNELVYALSGALDAIESEILGVTTNHGKRVAYLSVKMSGLEGKERTYLAAAALLHDNALSEFITEEYYHHSNGPMSLDKHCINGEKNIEKLDLHNKIPGVILYHHEEANGSGPFHLKAEDTPLLAQIVHLADILDLKMTLSYVDGTKMVKINQFLDTYTDVFFAKNIVDLYHENVDLLTLQKMADLNKKELDSEIPIIINDYSDEQLIHIAEFFGRIVDYKSPFTKDHSMEMADKMKTMAAYYQFDAHKQALMFFTGAMHDIGKVYIKTDVLEKQSSLTSREYEIIKTHVEYSHEILSQIHGLEDVARWAGNHHERLNGSGYPRGLKENDLDFESRLIGALDVYQALREIRPYKEELSHHDSMTILYDMVRNGELDEKIVKDIDHVFAD